MTEAPAFSVVADVAIVKGETPAGDRTWLSFPDGTARRAAVHVIQDLPHLVVESVFALDDGLWGTLAAGGTGPGASGPGASGPGVTGPGVTGPGASGHGSVRPGSIRHGGRIRLVTDAPSDDLATSTWPDRTVAKAAVNAVLNRWGDGPDTADGVRRRLRRVGAPVSGLASELAARLSDEQIRLAARGARRLYREWATLPVGGTLRATWPLHDSWLRLL